MTNIEELLNLEIDRLEAALTAADQRERELVSRADGLQRQLDVKQTAIDSLREIVRANAVAALVVYPPTTFRLPVFAEAEAWQTGTGE